MLKRTTGLSFSRANSYHTAEQQWELYSWLPLLNSGDGTRPGLSRRFPTGDWFHLLLERPESPCPLASWGKDQTVATRIRSKIINLALHPAAPNNSVKKLTGVEGYRLRIGDWRVIYTLKHKTLTVIVLHVGHRSEVYK